MRRRLILAAAYLLVAVLAGLTIPFATTLSRRLTDELVMRVERETFAVAAAVEDPLESGNGAALQPMAERIAAQIGGRVLVTDAEGLLVADSQEAPGPIPPSYASRPEIARALQGFANWEIRPSRALGYDLLVSAVPIRTSAGVVGAARVSYPMSEVRAAIRRSQWFLVLVAAAALAVGLALAAWLARWATRPLKSAAAVARRIRAGDLQARVPEEGPPEVQELARDLNAMTARLAEVLRADREFAANAAHQLRTPLAALRLSLEEAESGPDAQAEVEHALEEADRLSAVIDSLLVLGRAREPGSTPFDLGDVVRSVVESLAGDGPPVVVAGGGMSLAEPERARQVVSNLIDNARRFALARVTVGIEERADRVVMAVDDDGPGVSEDDRARVFDRFFRGRSPKGEGSGLGLAVARELAEADGATITVGDSPIGGARFEVTYRRAGQPGGPDRRSPTPGSHVSTTPSAPNLTNAARSMSIEKRL